MLKIEQSCSLTPDLGSVHNPPRFWGVTHIQQNRNGKITARPEKQKGKVRARLRKVANPDRNKIATRSRFEIEPFD